jgi:hypothetical protein
VSGAGGLLLAGGTGLLTVVLIAFVITILEPRLPRLPQIRLRRNGTHHREGSRRHDRA